MPNSDRKQTLQEINAHLRDISAHLKVIRSCVHVVTILIVFALVLVAILLFLGTLSDVLSNPVAVAGVLGALALSAGVWFAFKK